MTSQTEVEDLHKQLTAFAEANRLREELNATKLQLADAQAEIERLRTMIKDSDLLVPERPYIACMCCEADMAPADELIGKEWHWEDGKAFECEQCGWRGRVETSDGRHAILVDAGDDEQLFDDEDEEDISTEWPGEL